MSVLMSVSEAYFSTIAKRSILHRIVAVSFVLLLCSVNALGDEVEVVPVVTSNVKQIVASAPSGTDTMPVMAMAPVIPPATLPAERLPQYRVGYQRSDALLQSQAKDGAVRFALTHPMILQHANRPLLIEATILIDGEPFASFRERLAATNASSSTENTQLDQAIAPVGDEPPTTASELTKVVPETDDEIVNKKKVTPAIEPEYYLASDSRELMRRYADAVGEKVDESEAQWLMTHWTDGPTLLVLHPYYQNFRAEQRPAFVVLDIDRDGILSIAEIDAAAESFRRCDTDRNDVVDALEIAKVAEGLRDPSEANVPSGPLFWLLPDLIGVTENDPVLYKSLATLDSNQNGQIEVNEIDLFGQQTPDIRVKVALVSNSAGSSKLQVSEVNQQRNMTATGDPSRDGVNVMIGGLTLLISAIQPATVQPQSGQISIGAVVDGYPLLPELDPNGDGRFTIREMRTLGQRLRKLDRNSDQSLSRDECLPPIRVCIGFGPIVHEELANIRSIPPTKTAETIIGPQWFTRMDRNQDGDLTRSEFPGTDEQFAALDADGDLLISASEANEFEKQTDN